ncbi:MAG: methylthioribulose 1-phosphate dehydratase [Cyanobacterium sp. T60_A2020_053]|nr:methylthioribulose 1-phosphate dehydratase [Cyanobacterium sp. T60_A2020_053]
MIPKYSQEDLTSARHRIIEVGKYLDSKGWTPATSSNFSLRLDENYCAITVSGKHKGYLTPDDVMVVDLQGKPIDEQKPSAETLLHTTLYQKNGDTGAVLHTHSLNATVFSMIWHQPHWEVTGYELQKAFTGITSHESTIKFPIFDNSQDIANLAQEVLLYLDSDIPCWGYLIKGHGIYTWGETVEGALRHLEALEYLLQCQLLTLQLGKC